MALKDELLEELAFLLAEASELERSFQWVDMFHGSELPESRHRALATSSLATIRRIAGDSSEYYKAIPASPAAISQDHSFVSAVMGSLMALKRAVDKGYLETLEDRLRANVHDDFLDQARVLISSRYHVAAMVLIGGVLENRLRAMCLRRGLSWQGAGSLSKYNDLLRDNPYSQPVWRRIQSVTDLRNDAGHGNGDKVGEDDVRDACEYVSRFLVDFSG